MTFQSFDSLEEMQAAMAAQHDAAMASMGPMQQDLLGRRKFYWVRPYEIMNMFIFGEYDLDAWIAKEKSLWDPEDGPFEDYQKQVEHNNMVRGYKSGRAYSQIEPEGELGDTHVSQMYEISEQAFREAKQADWMVNQRTLTESPTLYTELKAYSEAEERDYPLVKKQVYP